MIWVIVIAIVGWFVAERIGIALGMIERPIEPQPCLSDDEFCRLLGDVSPDVALRVRGVLTDATGWDRDEIHPQTRLIEFEIS